MVISRAVIAGLHLPCWLFNAGLPHPLSVPAIDLQGQPARCLTQGQALDLATVHTLFHQGQQWGKTLAVAASDSYLILSECVVGGTTTALAVLTGLGIAAGGKVNSSHPTCNHAQKWDCVQQGLQRAGLWQQPTVDPWQLLAAVGDPMQVAVASMVIAASQSCGILLAGGTQMLAVFALCCAIAQTYALNWQPQQVVVGTTRWVAEDPTGDTAGLATLIGSHYGITPCLLATQLSFAPAPYPQLQVYEQGYVKEGVGAGGCAIAAHLYQGWSQTQLLQAIGAQIRDCIDKQS
ncbi:nicotinate mononucleotide-dependent phosphoribosyltransferase CobT [Neosynechococcus sphagnicola]|uniref:nicotinate mononucleotide-dependent phosphoribosyltransferase CobT n=1 Tax=Neosynechococcus sphagnicola TaxID=1501145 RepID=UPI001EF9F52B|nr:TIGR00303 family protein [Neosynechococcus sphagnicola]